MIKLFIFLISLTQFSHASVKLTQDEILSIIKKKGFSANNVEETYQKSPILFYLIDDTGFIPDYLAYFLGSLDQSKYTAEYYEKLKGSGAIALQLKDDTTNIIEDFYPVQAKTLNGYQRIDKIDVLRNNSKFASRLFQKPNLKHLVFNDSNIIGGIQKKLKNTVRLSTLGFSIYDEIIIEAPWSSTQTKPSGLDAYIVLNNYPESVYLINADNDGLPMDHNLIQ